MSETLAHAQQVTFKVRRQLDSGLADGATPLSSEIEIAISRPNKLQAATTNGAGIQRFYADGQKMTLFDERMMVFATLPMAGTIDDIIDQLDSVYGFTPPLAEFASNDPYLRTKKLIQSSAYIAKETINAVECNHFNLTGTIADVDLWIATADHLPRKFVATFKDRDGSPKLTVDFVEWNLAPKLGDSLFVFNPPKGAEPIQMKPIEDASLHGNKDVHRP